MKDILITGGAGKIGYNLVLKLLNSKYNITVLDLLSKKSEKMLSKISDKIKIVYGGVYRPPACARGRGSSRG